MPDPTSNESPAFAVRPTQKDVRENLLKDLNRPGFIVITHLGEVITKPEEAPVEEAPKKP